MGLYLRTLGELSLREDRSGGVLLHRSKPLAVCAYLAATAGHSARRAYLADLLWPEADQSRGLASLRQAIYYLSKKSETTLLDADDGTLSLRTGRLSVDLWEFQDHVDAGRCPEAADLYGGTFLSGFRVEGSPELSHWIESQQDRIWVGLRAALHECVARAIEEGRTEDALRRARRFVRLDPLDDRAQSDLVRSHLAAGNRVAAVQAYQRYRTLLQRQLDDVPGEELEARVAELRETLFHQPLITPGAGGGSADGSGPAAGDGAGGRAEGASAAAGREGAAASEREGGRESPAAAPIRRRVPGAIPWLAAGLVLGAGLGLALSEGGLLSGLSGTTVAREGAVRPPEAAGEAVPAASSGATELFLLREGGPGLWSLRLPPDSGLALRRTRFEHEDAVSPTRRRAEVRRRADGLDVVLHASDGGVEPLTDRPDDEWAGTWSPDDRYLLYSRHGTGADGAYRHRPWIYDRVTGHRRPLLPADALGTPGANVREADWSPTGLWIALSAEVDGNWEVFVVRPDGTGLRNVSDHPAADRDPSWCPRGRKLLFASDRGGSWDLYGALPPEGAPEPLTALAADLRDPVWLEGGGSGEETEVAVILDDGSASDLWTVDLNGDLVRRLTDAGDIDELSEAVRLGSRRWVDEVRILAPEPPAAGEALDVSPGQWLTLEARVRDARGLPASAPDLAVRWSASDSSVVRPGPDGRARVVGPGEAALIASVGGWRADTVWLRSRPVAPRQTGLLFREDWSAGLREDVWHSLGEPRPAVLALAGGETGPRRVASTGGTPAAAPAPSAVPVSAGGAAAPGGSAPSGGAAASGPIDHVLVSNGDAHYVSGVLSRRAFPVRDGLTVEYWARAPLAGRVHEALHTSLWDASLAPDSVDLARRVPKQVLEHELAMLPPGDARERIEARGRRAIPLPERELDDRWRRFALQLAADGRGSLVADGRLVWRSPSPLDLTGIDSVRVRLGGRTVASRPVHGPVRVYRGVGHDFPEPAPRLASAPPPILATGPSPGSGPHPVPHP